MQIMESGKPEQRILGARFEVRAASEDKPKKLVGHAAVFDQEVDFGWMRESIAPGAFTRSLSNGSDVRSFFNHDQNFVLGRTSAGTLKLSEDEVGLVNEIDPPDTQWARDLMVSISRGDISQQSFMFIVRKSEVSEEDDGTYIRRILDVDLIEAGPVTMPAYQATDIAARSMEGLRREFTELRKKPLANPAINLECLKRFGAISV